MGFRTEKKSNPRKFSCVNDRNFNCNSKNYGCQGIERAPESTSNIQEGSTPKIEIDKFKPRGPEGPQNCIQTRAEPEKEIFLRVRGGLRSEASRPPDEMICLNGGEQAKAEIIKRLSFRGKAEATD